MDKFEQTMQEVNPFGVAMEGPMQPSMKSIKYAPKLKEDGDIGRAGAIHSGGGDWG
ncbi:hypothetical protein L2Y94_11380 [Luteibacter aegosomatis]|uniref:hypothetical protein n=1 Tax=Luteibacter aegosomatis TaxID=2911537 RepID=UPI001FF9F20E|nr:hypothetical protein [Luteibacter aegosomatis]UPG83961.1 hypothetical protein L2Y94_11380 [Luteibacter aegosomatis]